MVALVIIEPRFSKSWKRSLKAEKKLQNHTKPQVGTQKRVNYQSKAPKSGDRALMGLGRHLRLLEVVGKGLSEQRLAWSKSRRWKSKSCKVVSPLTTLSEKHQKPGFVSQV